MYWLVLIGSIVALFTVPGLFAIMCISYFLTDLVAWTIWRIKNPKDQPQLALN